jgi:hypothetical protein
MKLSILILFILLLLIIPIVSATTVVIYPTSDGDVSRIANGNTYTTIRGGAGTNVYDASANGQVDDSTGAANPNFYDIRCEGYSFNTSSIPDSATINSATFGLYVDWAATNIGNPDYGISNGSFGDNTAIAAGDFQKRGSLELAPRIPIGSIAGGRNNWTLNSTGLSYINKTGFTVIFLRSSWDLDNSYTGTWGAWGVARIYNTYMVESADVSKRPFLVVNYTNATSAGFNVTADSVGTTWIRWTWGPGYNISGMWVDGYSVCGYDTLLGYVDIVDLTSCVYHTIMVNTTTSDSATNTTMTTCGTSDSGIKVVEDVPLPTEIIICSLCLSFIILGVRRK